MSDIPSRSDQAEGDPGNTPSVVPDPDDSSGEGWRARISRVLFGLKAASTRADLEQVLASGGAQSGFTPEERAMLKNILGLRERRIERVMVQRADIVAVQQDISLGDLVKVFEVAAHSRLVAYNDTLDDPVGMVHIRDLIAFMTARAAVDPVENARRETPLPANLDLNKVDLSVPLSSTRITREILYAPPSMPAIDLLARMQATRIHLSLVIDEYGGTDGLVSLEDLVELIVGDIADEHDEDERPAVIRQSDGSFMADGRASLEDVQAAIGAEFDVGEAGREVDTLGGYLVTKAGHVPVRGELVPGPGLFEAEVVDSDPRRIKKVKIYRSKDRRPGPGREPAAPAKVSASPPRQPRDDASRLQPKSSSPP
jgi:CBS domain containing-hemolysin-like protein